MKRLFWSCCIVLIGIFLAPCSSYSLMHISNSNIRAECWGCHPEGVGGGLPITPCLDCHQNSSGGGYSDLNTITMPTHSSTVIGSETYGTWERECLDCHDNHRPNGLTTRGGLTDSSYVLVDFTADYAVTDSGNNTTTFTSVSNITVHDSTWADPATWNEKTSAERGLLFLMENHDRYYWYEVVNATANSVTIANVSTYFPQAPLSNPFPAQLLYGMLLNDVVNDIPVEFGGPKFMANDESGTEFDPTPNGICQVCHTQTLHWRNDGSLANHFSGQKCTMCHPHNQGFKYVPPSPPLVPCE